MNKHTNDLSQLVTTANCVWNHIISVYRMYYKLFKKTPSTNVIQHHIAKIAKNNPYWSKMGSQSLQEICQRVDNSYKRFFKKLNGRPCYHKIDGNGSFVFKGKIGYTLDCNKLKINKLDYTYKFKLTREYGTVRNIAVKRDNMGYLWIVITTDVQNKDFKRLGNASIGMDFGLKHFITTSDGEIINSPETLKNNLKILRKASKNLSKKKKGSNSYKKAKIALGKLHNKVSNQRSDFQWKLSHKLCKNNSFIAVEDLNLKAMQKRWGRKVCDLGYSEFLGKLKQVALKYGTNIAVIDRFADTSQMCSVCGYKNTETKNLKIREWICPECGIKHDRDVNAAINILNIANGKGISHGRSNSKTLTNDAVAMITEESHSL